MLLNDILTGGVKFTPTGIQCSSESGAMKVFKFMREAILDRHVYVSKAVAVKFTNDVHSRSYTDGKLHMEGYYNCGESYPELTVNLLDKVFLVPPSQSTIEFLCKPGIVNMSDVLTEDAYLCSNQYVLRTLTNTMTLEIMLRYGSGFNSMSKNSKIAKGAFPLYTDYSLQDYVRVLPMMPGETFIKMKFLNGMTLAKFMKILLNWNVVMENRSAAREELLWLQNFGR